MGAMERFSFPVFLVAGLLVLGCQRDPITTDHVPKEPKPLLAPVGEAEASGEITWVVPKGWQEQAPSSMRVGSFLIKEENGQSADLSVVPLSGTAGGDLANINRWRGQIGLGPISEADVPTQSRTIFPAGRKMLWVDFAHGGRRLMAAIYARGERTWFFKMTGDDAAVRKAKPAMMRFLRSLTFHGH